jgi:hypothetical protein
MDEKRWNMNGYLGAVPQREQTETRTVRGLEFVEIDVWPFD